MLFTDTFSLVTKNTRLGWGGMCAGIMQNGGNDATKKIIEIIFTQ